MRLELGARQEEHTPITLKNKEAVSKAELL